MTISGWFAITCWALLILGCVAGLVYWACHEPAEPRSFYEDMRWDPIVQPHVRYVERRDVRGDFRDWRESWEMEW